MKSKEYKNETPVLLDADKTNEKDPLFIEVMGDFDSARKYVKENYQTTWENCFKAYNSIRTKRGYSGVADDFVPETFSIVESLKAAIAGTKPKFKYMPLNEEQEQDTDALNALVDFYWSVNNMTEKLLNWVGDMIIYGNGVMMVSWNGDKPLIQHIPLNDFFVDPTAIHLNNPDEPGYAKFAGYRYLTSLTELESEKITDMDTGELVKKYKNLDMLSNSMAAGDDTDKDRKEMFIGSVLGKDGVDDEVEVIVYFTRNKKIMIANRSTIIFDEANPYQRDESVVETTILVDGEEVPGKQTIPEIQGFLPFAILRNYVDSNLFFAKGDVEVILPTQEALNDTSSQKRDNLAYTLNNMWQIDPKFKYLADQLESVPGAVFPIPKGALSAIDKQDISAAADTEINRLTQIMRTASAADAAVQGVQQKFSRTTATEVQAQLQQASTRFTTKVQNLEDEGFAQLARIIYKMVQIFVDKPIVIRQVGKEGIQWKKFKPGQYNGEYEPRVILEATANAENAAIAQSMQIAAQFSLNNPLVNQASFLRKMYEVLFPKMSDEDITDLLTAPQPIMGPDGQAVDPALQQGNAAVTPGAAQLLAGEQEQSASRNGYSKFGGTKRGKASQTGSQGGGGKGTAAGNLPRARQSQASTTLPLSKPGK